jgi:hypothetical protein
VQGRGRDDITVVKEGNDTMLVAQMEKGEKTIVISHALQFRQGRRSVFVPVFRNCASFRQAPEPAVEHTTEPNIESKSNSMLPLFV